MAQDKLEFWQPKNDARVPDDYFAWGTVAPGSSEDRIFRIRNGSYAYTAYDIVVSLETMNRYEPALPVDVQHYLSRDGRLFTATVSIGDLAPRVISDVLILRRVTARLADEGPGEFQIAARAGDWS